MKHSIFSVVCAGIALAIGTANPAAAATQSGGYGVNAIYVTCAASGQGSGSINQGSAGCSDRIASGSFQASGSGQASYDTLRASAGIGFSDLDPSVSIGSTSVLGTASGTARYTDSLTIDIPGRTGQMVDLVFQSAMHGNLSASADYTYVYAQADAVLNVRVNGALLQIVQAAKSFGSPISVDRNPGRVQITLGNPFAVSAELLADVRLQRTGGFTQFFSGDAASNFSNSAGITSFMVFESGTGGALIPDWNLASESGQFGFYTAVPAPATVWLLAPALGLLAPWVKRKAKA